MQMRQVRSIGNAIGCRGKVGAKLLAIQAFT